MVITGVESGQMGVNGGPLLLKQRLLSFVGEIWGLHASSSKLYVTYFMDSVAGRTRTEPIGNILKRTTGIFSDSLNHVRLSGSIVTNPVNYDASLPLLLPLSLSDRPYAEKLILASGTIYGSAGSASQTHT